jgi:hypothetical protein
MNKNQAIRLINQNKNNNILNNKNTHWSNIVNYGSGTGWWLNIPFYKFEFDLHLILNDNNSGCFIHIKIPANSINTPNQQFRNKEGAADIFMPNDGINRLVDMQSNSSRHNFNTYEHQTIHI